MRNLTSPSAFIHRDFLLGNHIAQQLYHEYAANMPIIDYHNHLSPKRIAENIPYDNLGEAWLEEDHYKWRAMRANGVDEQYITGTTSADQKFMKWAETVPFTVRNPLFHWTQLELKRYFDIDEILQPDSADRIYARANEILSVTGPRQLLERMNVKVVCTTDDPADDLVYHRQCSDLSLKVLPTFRSDAVLDIENDHFNAYMKRLQVASGQSIDSLVDLLEVLRKRVKYFHEHGCRLSDYGLTGYFVSDEFTDDRVNKILIKKLQGKVINTEEASLYKSCLLYYLGTFYYDEGWVQQYHLGALRNNNSRLADSFGSDTGCDSIGDYRFATPLSRFLDRLDYVDKLTKTITYNLNLAHNEVFATMMGNFNTGGEPGKMQWGAAWWFNDQKDGIGQQIKTLSNLGLLSRFVGMLTDSRSFLSFPRHEYFRRILCDIIGGDIERGELPNDIKFFGEMIENICYNNAAGYFGFDGVYPLNE